MSKNIFLYNKITSQNTLDVNQLTVDQKLTLSGATPFSLLETDANSDVVTFNNGPANYVLEIDPTDLKPSWTNALTIDSVTLNSMHINSTSQADILCIGDNANTLARLPVGPNGYVVCSDTSTFGLNYKSVSSLLNLSDGSVFSDNSGNIYSEKSSFGVSGATTFSSSTNLFTLNSNVVNARNYKVTVSWNNLINNGGSNTYTLSITGQSSITYVTSVASSQENISTAFTANFSGSSSFQLIGGHSGGSAGANGTSNKVTIIVQPLGN